MRERMEFYLPGGRTHKVEPPQGVGDRILKEKGLKPVDQLADELGVGIEVVHATIDGLQERGYGVGIEDGTVYRTKSSKEAGVFDLSDRFDLHPHFGVISDTHLASKKERLDELNAMYDIFKAEGVEVVFHAGDITEGWGVYRGQEFEVKHFGQEDQIEYTVENYPEREGVTTCFITGNHDLRQYERGGVDPGVAIARQRPDMEYLGQACARVKFPNEVEMELLHPDGGVAYALSYKSQRYINNLSPQDVPHMKVDGHYHTTFYMYYRNVHFIQAPCFKDAGIYEKRKGLNPSIGGWIVDATISPHSDRIERFTPELFTFDGTENR